MREQPLFQQVLEAACANGVLPSCSFAGSSAGLQFLVPSQRRDQLLANSAALAAENRGFPLHPSPKNPGLMNYVG
jgi:hypothetical protein